jgi:hypothetical protein
MGMEEEIIKALKYSGRLSEEELRKKLNVDTNLRSYLVKMCIQEKIKRVKRYDPQRRAAIWRYYL